MDPFTCADCFATSITQLHCTDCLRIDCQSSIALDFSTMDLNLVCRFCSPQRVGPRPSAFPHIEARSPTACAAFSSKGRIDASGAHSVVSFSGDTQLEAIAEFHLRVVLLSLAIVQQQAQRHQKRPSSCRHATTRSAACPVRAPLPCQDTAKTLSPS